MVQRAIALSMLKLQYLGADMASLTLYQVAKDHLTHERYENSLTFYQNIRQMAVGFAFVFKGCSCGRNISAMLTFILIYNNFYS